MVRGRFNPGFTPSLLQEARAVGLEEMWMGLEWGHRVRELMDKGVAQADVVRIHTMLDVGIRIRALIVGFPETDAEFQETVSFILEHQDRLSFLSDALSTGQK